MDENPHRSPEATIAAEVVGVLSGSREDLRLVAQHQRGIQLCILVYVVAIFLVRFVPQDQWLYVTGTAAVAGAAIAGFVFVFMLATKVYGTGTGVFLGILSLVPLVGLIVLLVINQKATRILRQNKIEVGLLGADPSAI